VAYTQAQLWDDAGKQALAYLRNRGLSDDTIRFFGLGYNPADLRDKPDRWGLTGKDIWLPHGVVIPCQVAKAVWYVKFRRAGKPKYIQPRGSKAALFGADDLGNEGRLLLLTEGEFDCVLGKQELGDLVDVATLGGAARGIDARWLPYLLPYKRILAAYDQDEAGQKGSTKLSQASRRIVRINFADGGDLTDFYLAGGDLRGLLAGEVEKHLVM
jgi:DNA primase